MSANDRTTSFDPTRPVLLLVDADDATHDVCVKTLGALGNLFWARTSEEVGVALPSLATPAVALVDDVTTHGHPEPVIAILRKHYPKLRVIVLTSSREPEHTTRLAASGPLLAKPLDEARLRTAVKNSLRLQAMSVGVERMKTGEFVAFDLPPMGGSKPPKR